MCKPKADLRRNFLDGSRREYPAPRGPYQLQKQPIAKMSLKRIIRACHAALQPGVPNARLDDTRFAQTWNRVALALLAMQKRIGFRVALEGLGFAIENEVGSHTIGNVAESRKHA